MQPEFDPLWPKPSLHPSSKLQKFEFELFVEPALTQECQENPENITQEDEHFSEIAAQEAAILQEREKQELIEQEKRQAYEDGFEKGKTQGHRQGLEEEKQSIDTNINHCLQKLVTLLDDILSNQDRQRKELTYQVLVFSKQVLAKFFPVMEEKFGQVQIEDLVASILKEQKPSALILEVHPTIVQRLQQEFSKSFQERSISIEANEHMGLSDCKLSWEQGGIERDMKKIFQELELLFKGFEGILHEH